MSEQSPESPEQLFQRTLKVSHAVASRLASAEFTSIEEVAYVPFDELLQAGGLSELETSQLRRIARLYLENIGLPEQD
jgi:transcription termination factor NusA